MKNCLTVKPNMSTHFWTNHVGTKCRNTKQFEVKKIQQRKFLDK